VRTVAGIYWKKGFQQGGMKLEQVTGFVDILPTLVDIIGAKGKPKNPYDSISIYDVLRGKKKQIDRDMYLGCGAGVCQQYKLILAGQHLGLQKDFITDILQNPYETREGRIYEDPDRVVQLRKTVVQGDAIVPYQEEIPYGKGQKGFVAPKEWKITEY
jgi:arylsulfatase B